MLARTKSNSVLSRPRVDPKKGKLHEASASWYERSSPLIHKTITHTKTDKPGVLDIKLKRIYKKDKKLSFSKIKGGLSYSTLIVDKINNKTIPSGSLIVAINDTDLSDDYMGKGYNKFLSVYKSLNTGEQFTIRYRLIDPNLPLPYKLPRQLRPRLTPLKETIVSNVSMNPDGNRAPLGEELPLFVHRPEGYRTENPRPTSSQQEWCTSDEYCIKNHWGNQCDKKTGDCKTVNKSKGNAQNVKGKKKKKKKKKKNNSKYKITPRKKSRRTTSKSRRIKRTKRTRRIKKIQDGGDLTPAQIQKKISRLYKLYGAWTDWNSKKARELVTIILSLNMCVDPRLQKFLKDITERWTDTREAIDEMSVMELKELITRKGLKHDDCIEKEGLLTRAREATLESLSWGDWAQQRPMLTQDQRDEAAENALIVTNILYGVNIFTIDQLVEKMNQMRIFLKDSVKEGRAEEDHAAEAFNNKWVQVISDNLMTWVEYAGENLNLYESSLPCTRLINLFIKQEINNTYVGRNDVSESVEAVIGKLEWLRDKLGSLVAERDRYRRDDASIRRMVGIADEEDRRDRLFFTARVAWHFILDIISVITTNSTQLKNKDNSYYQSS